LREPAISAVVLAAARAEKPVLGDLRAVTIAAGATRYALGADLTRAA
jgi:hypothetical protein